MLQIEFSCLPSIGKRHLHRLRSLSFLPQFFTLARSEQGISKDTLDIKIKETLKQIGASVLEEKEE